MRVEPALRPARAPLEMREDAPNHLRLGHEPEDPRRATAALAEMERVAVSGGVIAAYVWDYAGKMELMRYFWDAAVELDPGAAKMVDGAISLTARVWAIRGTVPN